MADSDPQPTNHVNATSKPVPPQPKEPSLGPACLVISILSLAAFSAFCAFGSYIVFSDQYRYADDAIEQQLIPWVEQSQMAVEDKEDIVIQLLALIPAIQEKTIDREQLLRLRNCLQDNPVLMWGNIESILRQAEDVDMSDTERETLQRITQRLLRMAAERKLSRRDLEFTYQPMAIVRDDKMGLTAKDDLTAKDILGFTKRAEDLLEANNVPNEPYEKTPAEAFALLVKNALNTAPETGR